MLPLTEHYLLIVDFVEQTNDIRYFEYPFHLRLDHHQRELAMSHAGNEWMREYFGTSEHRQNISSLCLWALLSSLSALLAEH